MRVFASVLLVALPCAAADLLPLGKIPPGKVVLVPQPHHDDHTTDYGMGGLIARFVDEGYDAYYVRASNDEKDGSHQPGENDIINLRESIAATLRWNVLVMSIGRNFAPSCPPSPVR